MKISVLTVCFNAAETIEYAIQSFLAQSHPDKELIILDGASPDGTAEVARRFEGDNVTVVSEPDKGMYDALNKGLARFTGDAVGTLNADDCYADTEALARISAALEGADMVSGHLDFVDNHIDKNIVRRWRGVPHYENAMKKGWHPAHPTFYVRRKVAEAVGPFNLNYKTASDYDWMVRAHECFDFSSGFIDEILIHMMVGGKSTVSLASHIQHNLDSLRARREWMGAGLVDYALFAKPLRKLGQWL